MIQSSKVKMTIICRADLNCRKGKWISQGAHAASQWLIDKINNRSYFNEVEQQWLREGTTKICLQARDEAHLLEIYNAAIAADLKVHLVEDEGLTEFNHVMTLTCLAIGPHFSEQIDPITKELRLY